MRPCLKKKKKNPVCVFDLIWAAVFDLTRAAGTRVEPGAPGAADLGSQLT